MKLTTHLSENIMQLESILPIKKSFDIVTRNLHFGQTPAYWIGVNGFCDNEILLLLFSDLQNRQFTNDSIIKDINNYVSSKVGYIQIETTTNMDDMIKNLLSGPSLLLIDGFDTAIILDTRSYPMRSIEEPDAEKVTRGSKDGFVETIICNTALIRRRIRNPNLTFEIKTIGEDSKTDVAVGYVDGLIDPDLLEQLNAKLDSLKISALTMGSKSLEELMIKKRWYNPLPQIRLTERPDVACSFLLEGYITVIVDNSPTVMVFPCTLFQFTQHPDDYYQNPSIGNYLRFLRFGCIIVSLLLMPTFLLFGAHIATPPSWMHYLIVEAVNPIKLFIYVLLIEIGLDVFKYCSATAASGYSHSLSLIGGLIIGELAVELKFINTEVLFYGATTLLATVSIGSPEFSDGVRLYRLFLVIMTGFLGLPGYLIGLFLMFVSIITTKSFGNKSYLWPLFPFHFKSLWTLLVRRPTIKAQNIKNSNQSNNNA